ncbi:MAG TPA: hypothetical protein GX692_08250 [Acholeplasmataceae bacterium]|nr:hypothetical protein [Acholeplasmataceae bacterium]
MKKILIIMLFSFILIYLFPMQKVVAYSTGNGYYGTEIEGYEIIDTQYKYTKGTRIPLWIGGTDKHEYFTYYIYYKLRISTVTLADNSFKRVGSKITGAFSQFYELKKDYQMRSSLGWKVIDGASINLALTNYQSWQYRYVEGEEIEFSLENNSSHCSVALIALEIKILERYYLKEVKYGGFSGNEVISEEHYGPQITEYYFVIDYDLLPVNYSDLLEKNKFMYYNDQYILKPLEEYIPNFNRRYYEFLTNSIQEFYYYD